MYDENDQVTATIERMYKSNCLVKDRNLYYVDKGNNLVRLSITKIGNMPNYLSQVYNPFFEALDDGKAFSIHVY